MQVSQAEHVGDDMETEARVVELVTNARSSIAEEGVDVRSINPAPPADDKVTHLRVYERAFVTPPYPHAYLVFLAHP